ncbi:MAG: hypothetical protein AB7F88_10500 [Pyrinomonadaceae bacterium]
MSVPAAILSVPTAVLSVPAAILSALAAVLSVPAAVAAGLACDHRTGRARALNHSLPGAVPT